MRKIKVIFGVILVMVLMSLVCSCGSVRYIPVISHDSVYVNKVKYDSIYQRDSIYLTVKGDTVYKYQYAYRYRDKLIRDTISISKTDSIAYPVKGDTVYINKLNWYQNLSVWGFSIILGAIIIYIILKIRKIKLPL